MGRFNGGAGTYNNTGQVYEWSDVIVVIEDDVIVDYFTQFAGNAFPNTATAVTIGNFNVQLTSLTYRHFGHAVGAGALNLEAGARFLQAAGGFVIGGQLTNNGAMTVAADTTVTGAIENNHLMTVEGLYSFLKLRGAGGDFTLAGSGDLRLREGFLTGEGGDSSITDFYNSSRISGWGSIGAEFGWAAYPGDGGYLVVHNTAAGTIEADVSGRTLTLATQLTDANPVENAGLLAASNGATLELAGTRPIDNSPLFVVQSGAGTIKAFSGSQVLLTNAVVIGGTLDGAGTGVIQAGNGYSRLIDVDVTASATVNVGRWFGLEGAIENRGRIVADGFDSSTKIDAAGVTLSGGGSFTLVGNYGISEIVGEAPGAVLTNRDHSILGKGEITGGDLAVVNEGLIAARPDGYSVADTDILELSSLAGLTNRGILEASGAATLYLRHLHPVDNAGGIIRATGDGARVDLWEVTITGGTLHSQGGGMFHAVGGGVALGAVETTETTRINVGRGLTLEQTIINRGTITADDFYATIVIDSAGVQLSGGGEIVLVGNYGVARILGEASGAVLTNGRHTIRGDGYIGGAELTLFNSGRIIADSDPYDGHADLTIGGLASFSNTGRIEARNGSRLVLQNSVDGQIANAGGTILSKGNGSVVDLGNAVIAGGSLAARNGGAFTVASAGWDGRANRLFADLDMDLVNGKALSLMGRITSSGEISFTYRSHLVIAADTELKGGGEVTLNEGYEESTIRASASGTVLNNVDHVFAGTGSFGARTGLQLINGNAGVVTANQSGKTLRVETGATIRNAGVLSADGGILDVFDGVTGTGRLETANGGTLVVDQGTDHRVVFAGDAASTLMLSRRDSGAGGYDFAISGISMGDRIVLDVGAAVGQTAAFGFTFTRTGAILRSDIFADGAGTAYEIRLDGRYSEGQFDLVGGGDNLFGFVKVASRDGTKGKDVMTAGPGGERLVGFDGKDRLLSGAGDDVLDGSRGTDTADFSRATGGVTVSLDTRDAQVIGGGLGSDRLLWIENLIGSARADDLTGNAGRNRIDGGSGADLMAGGGGNDTYIVDNAGDIVAEAAGEGTDTVLANGNYRLGAGTEVEVLKAAARQSTQGMNLTGNEFDQKISGNNGANVLTGGGGRDTLRGYAGADTFVLDQTPDRANLVTILDFAPGVDGFLLSRAVFAGIGRGPLAENQFTANLAGRALDADDRIIYETDTGGVFFDPDGSGGVSAFRIANIDPGLALDHADFFVS